MNDPQLHGQPPEVSVIMAAYNEEHGIGAAIESIRAQSFRSWELVVIDDGSDDGTADVVQRLAALDDRIRLVCNDSNLQLSASLNRGVELARADLIARADADDLNLPDRLEKQVAFMRAHPEADVVGTGAHLLDAAGRRTNAVMMPTAHEALAALPFLKIQFFHPSVMIRRRFFAAAGMYDGQFPNAEDKELWLRGLAAGCRYANLDEPLIEYSTGGYVRSWGAIARNGRSLLRIARRHRVKRGYTGALLLFAYGCAIKLRLVRPRSLRLGTAVDG